MNWVESARRSLVTIQDVNRPSKQTCYCLQQFPFFRNSGCCTLVHSKLYTFDGYEFVAQTEMVCTAKLLYCSLLLILVCQKYRESQRLLNCLFSNSTLCISPLVYNPSIPRPIDFCLSYQNKTLRNNNNSQNMTHSVLIKFLNISTHVQLFHVVSQTQVSLQGFYR